MLRLAREPGERLIGWAPARVPMPAWQHLWLAAASIAPGAHGLAAVAIARSRRMVVLTDRRVLVLGVDRGVAKAKPKSVRAMLNLGELRLEVQRSALRRSVTMLLVRWDDDRGEQTLLVEIAHKAKGPARRLRDALLVLSSESGGAEDVLHEAAQPRDDQKSYTGLR